MKTDKELKESYIGHVKEFYKDKSFMVSIYSILWGTVKGIVANSEYTNAEIGQRIRALVEANETVKEEIQGDPQLWERENLEDEPEL